MINNLVDEARRFLLSYLENKSIDYEVFHPWRRDSKFVILHSFRVEAYALNIMDNEKGKLSEDEKTIVQVAAILHDIGRIDQRENHAEIGKNIVEEWLRENPLILPQEEYRQSLLKLIQLHSDKEKKDTDFACWVLQDADILDEIGVLSIFMASNWVDENSSLFFNELLDRIETYEVSFCEKQMLKLKTDSAKKILEEKAEFIKLFNKQLDKELEGTHEYYNLMKNQEKKAWTEKKF